ncbi:hypothetical protein [Halomonas sp. PA16-9]|uniref:hypothetical protein n=1 Tax=Halomonas sp. PA16-9 TaxID=2576841 RepID=UPI0012DAE8FF|nr:hypothetical protein FDY98_25840 [Halomonas sp. PA16-9]
MFDMLRGVKPGAGYSEVFVKHESGGASSASWSKILLLPVLDQPEGSGRLTKLTEAGHSKQEAIRMLAEGKG